MRIEALGAGLVLFVFFFEMLLLRGVTDLFIKALHVFSSDVNLLYCYLLKKKEYVDNKFRSCRF